MTDTRGAYREVIDDLKRRRDGIDKLIAELEAVVSEQVPSQLSADMPYRGMRVIDAAKAVLRDNGEPMSPAAITEQIRAGGCEVSSANTVASILNRYARDNDDVFSPGRGLWGIRSREGQSEPAGRALVDGAGELVAPPNFVGGLGDVVIGAPPNFVGGLGDVVIGAPPNLVGGLGDVVIGAPPNPVGGLGDVVIGAPSNPVAVGETPADALAGSPKPKTQKR